MFDDEQSIKKLVSLQAQLENASITELEARIERLRAEIGQCEDAIKAKRAQRAAADSVFGAERS